MNLFPVGDLLLKLMPYGQKRMESSSSIDIYALVCLQNYLFITKDTGKGNFGQII